MDKLPQLLDKQTFPKFNLNNTNRIVEPNTHTC